MARKGIGDFPKADPTEEVTGKGIAVLLLFFVLYVVLYALSYPLGRISGNPLLSVPFASPYTLICLVLAIAGLWLIIRHFKEFKVNDFAVSFLLSALVWLAIQTKYWYNGWTPSIPYYDPTFNAVEVFLITLGAIGLLKSNKVLRFRLAEDDDRKAVMSLVLGAVVGLPFAAINVLLLHPVQQPACRNAGRDSLFDPGVAAGHNGRAGIPTVFHGPRHRGAAQVPPGKNWRSPVPSSWPYYSIPHFTSSRRSSQVRCRHWSQWSLQASCSGCPWLTWPIKKTSRRPSASTGLSTP